MGNIFSKQRSQKYLIPIIISLALLLSGCGLVGKLLGNNPEQNKQEEKNEKVPKPLEQLDLTLENLFST